MDRFKFEYAMTVTFAICILSIMCLSLGQL